MIKIFCGGRGGDTFKTPSPSPYEQLLPLPTPCFEMFLERSLNDPPPPPPPLEASFTATPSPSTTPSITPSIKILIIHNHSPLIFSVVDVCVCVWGGGVRVNNIKLSSCLLFCLFLCVNMHLSI